MAVTRRPDLRRAFSNSFPPLRQREKSERHSHTEASQKPATWSSGWPPIASAFSGGTQLGKGMPLRAPRIYVWEDAGRGRRKRGMAQQRRRGEGKIVEKSGVRSSGCGVVLAKVNAVSVYGDSRAENWLVYQPNAHEVTDILVAIRLPSSRSLEMAPTEQADCPLARAPKR